jgi:hypothetical protein
MLVRPPSWSAVPSISPVTQAISVRVIQAEEDSPALTNTRDSRTQASTVDLMADDGVVWRSCAAVFVRSESCEARFITFVCATSRFGSGSVRGHQLAQLYWGCGLLAALAWAGATRSNRLMKWLRVILSVRNMLFGARVTRLQGGCSHALCVHACRRVRVPTSCLRGCPPPLE